MTLEPKIDSSKHLFESARRSLVGGVNSPVRAFGAVSGTPRFIASAAGAVLTDVDGNKLIDFVGSWGPMILGHHAKPVVSAVLAQLKKGASFGAPTALEVEIADVVQQLMPSIERIRFTNSGTEATMTALRIARAATRRERILKFEGGYHGHSDALLVSAGSGATTFGVPSSAGVPSSLARNTWVLPFNDLAQLEHMFSTQGPNIAAAIIEPVCGNMGVVLPEKRYLAKLSALCESYGTILIFDEVMTGFRLGLGGAQELFGIKPDLTCLGKIIGGGFPVGAVGGRAELMDLLAPSGPVYQAGTLSGNPIAMAAGLAVLRTLKKKLPYAMLEKTTNDFCTFIRATAAKQKVPVQVNHMGSMFTVFFTEDPVVNYFTAMQSDKSAYGRFFHALLNRGVYLPPSQFEAAFISTAHTKAVMEKARKAVVSAFRAVAE